MSLIYYVFDVLDELFNERIQELERTGIPVKKVFIQMGDSFGVLGEAVVPILESILNVGTIPVPEESDDVLIERIKDKFKDDLGNMAVGASGMADTIEGAQKSLHAVKQLHKGVMVTAHSVHDLGSVGSMGSKTKQRGGKTRRNVCGKRKKHLSRNGKMSSGKTYKRKHLRRTRKQRQRGKY